MNGWPPGGDALIFSRWGEFSDFVFPGEGEWFFEDFGSVGPIVEVFEVSELEFG